MDVLPRALPTKMTVLSTGPSDYSRPPESPAGAPQPAAQGGEGAAAPRSPCHQMSVDYPDPEDILRSPVAGKTVAFTQVVNWFAAAFLLFNLLNLRHLMSSENNVFKIAHLHLTQFLSLYFCVVLFKAKDIYVLWILIRYFGRSLHSVLQN